MYYKKIKLHKLNEKNAIMGNWIELRNKMLKEHERTRNAHEFERNRNGKHEKPKNAPSALPARPF